MLDVHNLAENQEDLDLVNLGPAKSVAYVNGEISRAGLGFAKSQGIEPEQLEIVSTPKGEYIAARKFMKGKATKELLSEILKFESHVLNPSICSNKSGFTGAPRGSKIKSIPSLLASLAAETKSLSPDIKTI